MGKAAQRFPHETHDTHLLRTIDKLGDPFWRRRGRLLEQSKLEFQPYQRSRGEQGARLEREQTEPALDRHAHLVRKFIVRQHRWLGAPKPAFSGQNPDDSIYKEWITRGHATESCDELRVRRALRPDFHHTRYFVLGQSREPKVGCVAQDVRDDRG